MIGKLVVPITPIDISPQKEFSLSLLQTKGIQNVLALEGEEASPIFIGECIHKINNKGEKECTGHTAGSWQTGLDGLWKLETASPVEIRG